MFNASNQIHYGASPIAVEEENVGWKKNDSLEGAEALASWNDFYGPLLRPCSSPTSSLNHTGTICWSSADQSHWTGLAGPFAERLFFALRWFFSRSRWMRTAHNALSSCSRTVLGGHRLRSFRIFRIGHWHPSWRSSRRSRWSRLDPISIVHGRTRRCALIRGRLCPSKIRSNEKVVPECTLNLSSTVVFHLNEWTGNRNSTFQNLPTRPTSE